MATEYKLPEEMDEKLRKTLGNELETKTFKTNVPIDLNNNDAEEFVKIICVGDSTGGLRIRTMFIKDYLQLRCPGLKYEPFLLKKKDQKVEEK